LSKKEGAVVKVSNSISELRQQIYHDLRIQHPEWVELNGECSMCDSYVARLMEELSIAEGTSEAFGGWAHRDPDRLDREKQGSGSFVRS
jgi:hypothetical protein